MLTCVILTNDSILERNLIRGLARFSIIEIMDILSDSISVVERLYHLKPDIFIVDMDDARYKHLEISEMGNHIGVSVAVTSRIEKSYSLINNGFYDVLDHNDLSFEVLFRRVNRLLKFIYFFMGKPGGTPRDPLPPKQESEVKESLFIRFNRKKIKVNFQDILYVQNINHVLELFLSNGQTLWHHCTLKKFLELLPSSQFARINNATIINHGKIDELSGKEVRIGDRVFVLSKNYAEGLKKALHF